MQELKIAVESAFSGNPVSDIDETLARVYSLLESGDLRVAERRDGLWVTNDWVKKAILLSFKRFPTEIYKDGVTSYFDRVAPRFKDFSPDQFRALRSAHTSISPAALESAVCWSRHKLLRRSSRTIVSSAPDLKSSKGSSSNAAR